jgi:hypothetical protein
LPPLLVCQPAARLDAHAACAQVFREYSFTAHDGALRKCFSTSLSNLVDSLAVCAGSDGMAELSLKWPDQDGRLLLQCVPAARGASSHSAACDSQLACAG